MKEINKLCISALVLGGIGCAVFGSLMVANGQEGMVLNYFSFGHQGSGIGFFDAESSMDFSSPVEMGDEIDSLDFEVGGAKLIIEPGASFSIAAQNVNISTCEVLGGVWTLETANMPGINSGAEITVTVPGDRGIDLDAEIGAGELQIGEIRVNDFVVSIGAGSVKTELMDVYGVADIEVGAGSLSAKMTNPADVWIDCGMGSVSLELTASQDAYNILADCGMGSVKAGTLHIDGAGDKEYTSSSADYEMSIDCGMGSVKVLFGN